MTIVTEFSVESIELATQVSCEASNRACLKLGGDCESFRRRLPCWEVANVPCCTATDKAACCHCAAYLLGTEGCLAA